MPEFDNTQAGTEGWGIFDCDGSDNGRWQIQRSDADNVFENDDMAWVFIAQKASEGSAYHAAAIEYIRQNNQTEYEAFAKHTGYGLI